MESGTRRRLSGIALAIALGALFVIPSALKVHAAADSEANAQMGVFALQGGTQTAIAKGWARQNMTGVQINVRQYESDGTTQIRNYNINGQHTIRLIVVEDNFKQYSHLDPYYNLQTGGFAASFTAAAHHTYYLYADSLPLGMHRQVFRFHNAIDPNAPPPQYSTTPTKVQPAGPYIVTLERDTFPANSPEILYWQVTRGGSPAQDLTPYYGAAAEATFINAKTLEYVHLHPVLRGMKINKAPTYTLEQEAGRLAENSQVGPNMQTAIPPLPAGVYKLWVEFKGGIDQSNFVTSAPFTIVVQ